jgi:hypothetical protein
MQDRFYLNIHKDLPHINDPVAIACDLGEVLANFERTTGEEVVAIQVHPGDRTVDVYARKTWRAE